MAVADKTLDKVCGKNRASTGFMKTRNDKINKKSSGENEFINVEILRNKTKVSLIK